MIHFENHHFDDLQTPGTLERATWYGVVSHPHVRFDGLESVVGATSCDAAEQSYRDKIEARIAATGGVSPVEIVGAYQIGDTEVSIEATFRLVDPVALTDLRATFLIYENNVFYCCGYDGSDTWQLVTRKIYDENIALENVEDQVVVGANIPIDPEWNPAELHVVAYLQSTSTKEIIQGVYFGGETADVDASADRLPGARIDSVQPNPFRPTTEIAFSLSGIAARGPVELTIVDLEGRRVASLLTGTVAPGTHRLRWDGATDRGTRAGSGVYFARLATIQGITSRKLLLLE